MRICLLRNGWKKYRDIGYGVRPVRRRKGFASLILGKGVEICRELGMKSVIVGCYKSNAHKSPAQHSLREWFKPTKVAVRWLANE
ncbi:GNAT family N-acetyltransferase [Catenibacillus scindens]|uniref:GNAT family N-acetyltransferase n=1 Tax=Catenibacillus scindens TaxID=673271 RepID=UPI0038B97282